MLIEHLDWSVLTLSLRNVALVVCFETVTLTQFPELRDFSSPFIYIIHNTWQRQALNISVK